MTHPDQHLTGQPPEDVDFAGFFRATYPQVVRIAYRILGSVDAAQDVAQDVFASVHPRFPDGLSNPTAWVRAAAGSKALNEVRSSRRRQDREDSQPLPSYGPSAEEAALAAVDRDRVRQALGRLSEEKATVLVLRHSGLSYVEIADAMGLRPGSVGTTLRRAEEAFRKEVTR